MTGLLLTLPGVPGVEIQVQQDSFADKQQRVDYCEHEKEVIDEPRGELRIRREEHENKKATGEGSHAVENDRHLCDLFCQAIVSRLLLPIPHPF